MLRTPIEAATSLKEIQALLEAPATDPQLRRTLALLSLSERRLLEKQRAAYEKARATASPQSTTEKAADAVQSLRDALGKLDAENPADNADMRYIVEGLTEWVAADDTDHPDVRIMKDLTRALDGIKNHRQPELVARDNERLHKLVESLLHFRDS